MVAMKTATIGTIVMIATIMMIMTSMTANR